MTNPYDRIEEGRRLLAAVQESLVAGLNAFHLYEEIHLQKGSEEGDEKASRNAALAVRMEEGLAALNALKDTLLFDREAAHARIAALEEGLKDVPQMVFFLSVREKEMRDLLGNKHWEAIDQIGQRAATLLSSASGGEGDHKCFECGAELRHHGADSPYLVIPPYLLCPRGFK